eukprot:TRINITY_DN4929_c0_g1_i6.p1 TRINITY_DN4929_c0_g1~~TRINITY_DN4929_c0_g1_i6.p1  ORF type:complete len:304 (+),score=70.73 TRINITY_DN4929_c0_g1_i6:163-1074(+)
MLRSLVGSEMCIRDSINAEYGDPRQSQMDEPQQKGEPPMTVVDQSDGLCRLVIKTRVNKQRRSLEMQVVPQELVGTVLDRVRETMNQEVEWRRVTPRLFLKGRELDAGQSIGECTQGSEGKHTFTLLLAEDVCPTFRVGERVEALWLNGAWYPGMVIARENAVDEGGAVYTVKWEGEESHTKAIPAHNIRPRAIPVEQPEVTIQVPVMNPSETKQALQTALQDKAFRDFLQSPIFEQMFAPIKQMVHSQPEALPHILEQMQASEPQMLATLLPFVLCELEVVNPPMFEIVSARFNHESSSPSS